MKRRRLTLAEDLLSVFDVAELVGRSVSTVYDWHERGLIPAAIEFGGRYRWRKTDIIEWAEAGFPQREPEQKRSKAKA